MRQGANSGRKVLLTRSEYRPVVFLRGKVMPSSTYTSPGFYMFVYDSSMGPLTVECWGAGGGSVAAPSIAPAGGGGGGAYARSVLSGLADGGYGGIVGGGDPNTAPLGRD